MAATEQPLKKRKLYEPPPPSSPPPPPPPPPQPPTPPPLSQEEILRRRRSKEEIRNVFECFKKIKSCVVHKDGKSRSPELEEAYLALIAAAKGSASVQRLASEYIPRYASYCPNALEAAASVVINMHNVSFTSISKGEDIEGIAFETAKACIFGLVDICQAAATEASTSTVIQGICSAVFHTVLTFFLSSFDQKDLFDIVDHRLLQIYEVADSFSDFKHEILEEDSSVLLKLSKLRALSFLRVFFSCPNNSIVTCFELCESTVKEGTQKGSYLLRQLTNELNDVSAQHLNQGCDDDSSNESTRKKCIEKHPILNHPASEGSYSGKSTPSILKNCLLGLVLDKDPSFKSFIFSRYRMLCDSASPEVVSDVSSVLERVFESFIQQVNAEDSRVDSVVGKSGSSKYASQYLVKASSKQGSPSVGSRRDCPDKLPLMHLPKSSPVLNAGIEPFDGESKSMDFHFGDSGDHTNSRNLMPRELLNRQSFSPRARMPRDFRNNSFNGRNHSTQMEKSPIQNRDLHLPTSWSSVGAANSPLESPKQNVASPHSSMNHAVWYSDGDPAAMDIFPASRQLWLGSLGPDASEMLVRFQFEKFGPIDQFGYFPYKGFATIEYKNIMDALKAREVMRGRSPWGGSLRIKFLDAGLGTRGAINGTAVGTSCHVYIGNVSSIWAKDEMIHEVKKVLQKGPRTVIDLSSEGALLVEFDSPEESAIIIGHLRWHRKESNNSFQPPPNVARANLTVRPASASVHADKRNNFSANSMIESPHAPTDSSSRELTSPRISQDNCGPMIQTAHAFQSTWTGGGTMGQSIPPPPPPPAAVQLPQFARPFYGPPNSMWDARGMVHHMPAMAGAAGVRHTNSHSNIQGPPFVPASVIPLAQIQGNSRAPFDQTFPMPVVPPPLSSLPPPPSNVPPPLHPQSDYRSSLASHPELQPPLPPNPPPPPPPPPPHSQPPAFPPPPSSPPPPPPSISADTEGSRSSQHYPWQGILSKSGVNYCTIHAQRVDSDICNYSNAISEPAEWPVKLDMTKRTDLRHVKSSFSCTAPQRREICWLLPSSHGDHKGFQDFISYLKQRNCAGVIKIPAVKSMWPRLLFILPYSPEMCSMLSIPPNPSLCLIGLILPKETNAEVT